MFDELSPENKLIFTPNPQDDCDDYIPRVSDSPGFTERYQNELANCSADSHNNTPVTVIHFEWDRNKPDINADK